MKRATLIIESDDIQGLFESIKPYIDERIFTPSYPSPSYPGNIPNLWDIRKQPNPCDTCPNNPINNPFSSGFCNCILGNLNNITF